MFGNPSIVDSKVKINSPKKLMWVASEEKWVWSNVSSFGNYLLQYSASTCLESNVSVMTHYIHKQ